MSACALQEIDLRNDATVCDELIARLVEMRASWVAMATAEPTAAVAVPRAVAGSA